MNADVTRLLSILAQTAAEAPPPPPPPQQRPQFPPTVDPRLSYGYQPDPPPLPAVDPKGITDWPTALKYVMNTLYKDGAVITQVKRMKKHQHDHEKQWWAAREEIIKKHESRIESNRKVTDLLRKLGTMPPSNLPTPESEKEELRIFDQKVHLRSEEMVKHMATELAGMGVPFFCRADLPGKDEASLQTLRKRIVELLEDLCEGE